MGLESAAKEAKKRAGHREKHATSTSLPVERTFSCTKTSNTMAEKVTKKHEKIRRTQHRSNDRRESRNFEQRQSRIAVKSASAIYFFFDFRTVVKRPWTNPRVSSAHLRTEDPSGAADLVMGGQRWSRPTRSAPRGPDPLFGKVPSYCSLSTTLYRYISPFVF